MKIKVASFILLVAMGIGPFHIAQAGVSVTAYELVNEEVVSPALFFSGEGITYMTDSGAAVQYDIQKQGNAISLANRGVFPTPPREYAYQVLWPSSGNSIIVRSGAGLSVYQPDTNTYVDLPDGIFAISWMPSGTEFVYAEINEQTKITAIYKSSLNNQNKTLLYTFPTLSFVYSLAVSPSGQEMAMGYFTIPSDSSPISYKLVTLPITGGQETVLDTTAASYDLLWNPQGSRLLYGQLAESPNGNEPLAKLFVYDKTAGAPRLVTDNATATTSVWSKDGAAIYASSWGTTAQTPFYTIKKIEASTGTTTATFQLSNNSVQPNNMIMALSGEVIYFVDVNSRHLYFVDLAGQYVGGSVAQSPATEPPIAQPPVVYPPSGSPEQLVKLEGGSTVYVARDNYLYGIENYLTLKYYQATHGNQPITVVNLGQSNYTVHYETANALLGYPVGEGYVCDGVANDKYPPGSLVNDKGTIYLIQACKKIPFTNYKAFTALGYSLKNVVKGDLSKLDLQQTSGISSGDVAHTWGSWINDNGTIYYSHRGGMIGMPSYELFLHNGGKPEFVVPANSHDRESIQNNDYRGFEVRDPEPFVLYGQIYGFQ